MSARGLSRALALLLIIASSIHAQVTVSNPNTRLAGCDAFQCSDNALCNTDSASYVYGVGVASQVLPISGSSANLTLSLIDEPGDVGIFAFPGYDYLTHGQRLLVGAPSNLNLQSQPRACALMFQNQGQTFPFLVDRNNPNTTVCGDALAASDLNVLGSFVRDFDLSGRLGLNQSAMQVPLCSQLASYVYYRIRERSDLLGAYYSTVLTITGGAFAGPDANTTGYVPSALCRPVLPQSYQLYDVLQIEQVLHPPAASDSGFGGRNGTTPVLTVVYDGNGSPADIRAFCMRQYAPGGRALPQQEMRVRTSASNELSIPRWTMIGVATIAGFFASQS